MGNKTARGLAGMSLLLLLFAGYPGREGDSPQLSVGEAFREGLCRTLEESVCGLILPVFTGRDVCVGTDFGNRILEELLPAWLAVKSAEGEDPAEEDADESGSVRFLSEEDLGNIHAGRENTQVVENDIIEETTEPEEVLTVPREKTISGEKAVRLVPEELFDYETLVKTCYAIDPNTEAGPELLNAEKMLGKDFSLEPNGEEIQILIYHTHSMEGFTDSDPATGDWGVMGVGEELARILREDYGYGVLHHLGQYDVESRDDAYSKALPELEKILEEHPEIRVVIDLHRDEMPEQVHLVTEVDGKPTARFMFFNGLSHTRKTGDIAYLRNDNLEDNLAFSFRMQLAAMEYYPGLTRKIYLKGYRYNMHLRPRNLLVELGAQNNTEEEARNACAPLARILDLVLSGEYVPGEGSEE